jgi:hypothetical protein
MKNLKEIINTELKTTPVAENNSSIFAIVCSATPELRSVKFYGTREIARRELKKLADERRYKMGVEWHEETKDMFFYTLGWEERPVRYSIVELHVEN